MRTLTHILSRREAGVIFSLSLMFIVFLIGNPQFFSIQNIQAILLNAAWIGIIAIGQSLALGAGVLDLSVSSLYGFSALMFVIISNDFGLFPGFFLTLLIAITFGFANGVLVTKLRINPLIVTLGTQYFARGLIYLITRGFLRSLAQPFRDAFLVRIFTGTVGGWNLLVFWLLFLTIIFQIILFRTKFGQDILAVGSDPQTSLSRGISPNSTLIKAFMVTGLLAGFSGIMAAMELVSVSADMGVGMELKSIAAGVLGGCSLMGGIASPLGAVLGAIFLSGLYSGMIMLGAPPYAFIGAVGVALIGGVALNDYIIPWLQKKLQK